MFPTEGDQIACIRAGHRGHCNYGRWCAILIAEGLARAYVCADEPGLPSITEGAANDSSPA